MSTFGATVSSSQTTPQNSSINFQAAPLVVNGQPLNGGFGINYDLGPSVADLANQSFQFINSANTVDQAFLGQTISGSQSFLQGQLTPITAALSSATAGMNSAISAGASAVSAATSTIVPTMQFTGTELNSVIQTGNMGQQFAMQNLPDIYQQYNGNVSAAISGLNANSALAFNSINTVSQASQATSQAVANSGGGGGCFITTAICDAEGLADDCDELETLRFYRDYVLRYIEGGADMIRQYYREAPGIVARISERADAGEIWRKLREGYLGDAIHCVKVGAYKAALDIYRRMFEYTKEIAGQQ